MAFWGVEVKPGEPYVHHPSSTGRRLKICQALLGSYGDTDWTLLECIVGENEPVRLCALNPANNLMCQLNLEFRETETVVFSVSGNSSIHLSGYYICSHKLTSKSARPTCLKGEVQGDDVDGKNHGPPKDCLVGEGDGGKNDSSPKKPMVSEAIGYNDASLKGPVVSEADGDKNGASPTELMISEAGCKDDISLKVPVGNEADAKNDASLKEPLVHEADGNNGASLTEPLASELDDRNDVASKEIIASEDDGKDNVSPKEPMSDALSKRIVAENIVHCLKHYSRINKSPRKEHVLRESSAVQILPVQDQEISCESNVARSSVDPTNHESIQDNPIMDGGFLYTGASELQGVRKQPEDVEHCRSVHARKAPMNKVTLENGLIIEDLDVGRAKGKIASDGREITLNCVCKLMDGHAVNPVDGNNIQKFKLGAGQVIRGLELGVSGYILCSKCMRKGGKRKLTIPPELGHGDKAEGEIPANSWLIYEVELTKVKRPKKASDQAAVMSC
ncbi:hypothetical protein ACP4OV_016686 [Aristida adscensionis]